VKEPDSLDTRELPTSRRFRRGYRGVAIRCVRRSGRPEDGESMVLFAASTSPS
jgi:hypothetical protein